MTITERAVRKAGRERLLQDFARAAAQVRIYQAAYPFGTKAAKVALAVVATETSRTRYACLMTAFGL